MLPTSALPSSQHPQWWRLPGGPQRSWRLAYLSHQITTVSILNHWFHMISYYKPLIHHFLQHIFHQRSGVLFPSSTTIWGACVCVFMFANTFDILPSQSSGGWKTRTSAGFHPVFFGENNTIHVVDLMIDHPPNLNSLCKPPPNGRSVAFFTWKKIAQEIPRCPRIRQTHSVAIKTVFYA